MNWLVTRFRFFQVVSVVGMVSLLACGQSEEAAPAEAESAAANAAPLVIYSGRGAVLVDPLIEQFTEQTGIDVDVRYEKSTETLANRIATEGDQTQADVFFAQDSGWLGALAEQGHLEELNSSILSQVSDYHRDANGRWVGTSGRARVLVYSPDRVTVEELPKTLADLPSMAQAGRVGWAPSNGSFQAHVSALRHIWGEEKTRAWLESVKALDPKIYPKNSPQVRAVSSGEIDLGWVNHYYLHKLRASNPDLKAANYSFVEPGDAGNLMMLSGAAVVSASDQKEKAEAFIEFLLSENAQGYFAQKTFEYPTVPGVALHPDVPPIDDRMVRADQRHLTDLSGTVTLLREVGLQ